MRSFLLDLNLVLRQLRKSPGFTATAVLMLALGMGATTAIFSIVESVLLRPLPFPNPDRLVALGDHLQGTEWGKRNDAPVTAPDIAVYSRDTRAFASMGGYTYIQYELSGAGQSARLNAVRMSAGVFPALQVAPLLGRTFTAQEDTQRQQVTVLSYETWKNRFHSDPRILGAKVLLDRKPYLVIGVMPRGFEFPLVPGHLVRTELWVPMSSTERELTQGVSEWSYLMLGRMKPGVTLAQAQGDAERVAQQIMRSYGADMASMHINAVVRPLRQTTDDEARPLVQMLSLAIAVVLLIACVNLAGLLLVRAIRRQREIAVRLALGASVAALLRQVLLESLLVSASGGVLGIALAALALHLGKSLLPESLPRIDEIALNWHGVGVALLLAGVTGLLCGLAPAFAALRTNVNAVLKEGGRSGSTGGSHTRLRSALVVAEIAVALSLLTASGLLLRSFAKMNAVDLGFRTEHVTTGHYALPHQQYATQTAVNAFNHELLRRLRQLPGAEAVGVISTLPTIGDDDIGAFVAEGFVPSKEVGMNVATPLQVLGDYFRTMQIPLLAGRFFTEADRADTQLAVIVNRKFAEHYWPHQDPLGKRMRIGTPEMKTPWMTVVGEIADVKLGSPDTEATKQFYQPVEQVETSLGSAASPLDINGNGGYIVLRSAVPPERMENSLRAAVHSIDPQLPLSYVHTMEQVVAESAASRRFNTTLITSFALVAMLLAMLGIYSVISFSVASRVQEMAIRMALGSQRRGIVRLIVISGVKLGAIGCAVGIAGSVAASGLLRSLLFDVSPFEPLVLTAAAAVVLLLAVAASAVPALRAASIDPVQALRGE